MNGPTPLQPVMLDCPACGGSGCDQCDASGRFELAECPRLFVTPDVWDGVECAGLYEKGLPPVAGGSLDQSRIFVEAARLIWADQAYWKAKLRILPV